jgi:peptidyl-prolyl cis-trans isomerase A (cyclophilin A)
VKKAPTKTAKTTISKPSKFRLNYKTVAINLGGLGVFLGILYFIIYLQYYQTPAAYKVQFVTTKGNFTVEVNSGQAPNAADRFYKLVTTGYYNNSPIFRVVPGFVCQFGVNPDPKVTGQWQDRFFKADPMMANNTAGTIDFATSSDKKGAAQVFINYVDSTALDQRDFAPFGKVIEGMDVVKNFYSYGEIAPKGKGPDESKLITEGAAYAKKSYPKMDYIKTATIIP